MLQSKGLNLQCGSDTTDLRSVWSGASTQPTQHGPQPQSPQRVRTLQ